MRSDRLICAALVVFLSLAKPALADALTAAEAASLQSALNRGQLLHAYDQAAWHGTDALMMAAAEKGGNQELAKIIGGWIVVGTANDPTLIFFDKGMPVPKAVFIARLTDGGRRVVSSGFVEGADSALEAEAVALIRARNRALEVSEGQELLRCASGPFNTAVLPPDAPGGVSLVYLLSPKEQTDQQPFGGHHRIEVAEGETAPAPAHAFTRSCLSIPTSAAAKKPEAAVVTQLLDPLPSEIAVFTMLSAEVPLYVLTPDKRIWVVESVSGQARIRLMPDKVAS